MNTKKLSILCSFLLLGALCFAQNTAVTATITDSTGQAWTFGNFSMDFVRNPSFSGTVPLLNGVPIQEHGIIGSLNTTALFTVTLPDVLQVSPSGGQWQFTICPNASASCSTILSGNLVTGASTDLSTFLSTHVTPPQVNPTNINRAYKDTEVAQVQGGFYYDVVLNCLKFGNGSIFSCITGGGGGLPPAGSGTNVVTTNLSSGGTSGICAEWSAGGVLANAVSGLPCGSGGGGGGSPGAPVNSLQGNNASAFAGIPNTVANFTSGEVDIQNAAGTRNVTFTAKYNWSQSGVANTTLTAGSPATITLTPCPIGVDVSGNANLGGPQGAYPVYITDGSNSESAYVSGGSCTSGGASGTIQFTPFFSHTAAAYTLGSATQGAQEAVNDGCGFGAGPAGVGAGQCKINIQANGSLAVGGGNNYVAGTVTWHDTLYFHAYNSILSGYGVQVDCQTRGPCLQTGNLLNSNRFTGSLVEGISFGNSFVNPIYDPCSITNTARTSLVVTITLASSCTKLRTGDRVTIILTDDTRYRGDVPSITVVDATHFTYTVKSGSADIPTHASLGFVALTHVAILDNATGTTFTNIQNSVLLTTSPFMEFFDMWDDESARITHFNNNAIAMYQNTIWMGYIVYSGGAANLPTTNQLAPVISFQNGSITNTSGFWIENSNGLYVRDTVIQNSIQQAHVTTINGNFQGAYFENIYSETNASANSTSPWVGTGVAGADLGTTSGTYEYRGNGSFTIRNSALVKNGSGGTCFTYYVVAHDTTAVSVTAPIPVMYACQNAASTPTVSWPRIVNFADAITYDVLRCPGQLDNLGATVQSVAPYIASGTTGSPGGSINACGSIVTGQAQANSFVQTFVDNTANSTTAYAIATPTTTLVLDFWPGQVVTSDHPLISTFEQAVSGLNVVGPVNIADFCGGTNIGPGGYTTCIGTNFPPNNSIKNSVGLLLQDGAATGGGQSLSKGKIIFTTTAVPSIAPHHMITLVDSGLGKTQAFSGYRPLADPNDTYLGVDGGSGFGNANGNLSIGSNQISMYIGNVGDNTSWKERLNSVSKTFTVPVTITGNSQISTGTASNTDLVGELAFSAATTSATYTFAGTYVSHPECTFGPLFTPGAGHVIWISTLSTTTLQFSSDVAQTGAVSYICHGRN